MPGQACTYGGEQVGAESKPLKKWCFLPMDPWNGPYVIQQATVSPNNHSHTMIYLLQREIEFLLKNISHDIVIYFFELIW